MISILHSKAIPPFAALRAFEAVGRCGGIRKAALALNTDHAVVSRHVRLLEKWLDVVLVQRINGEMRLSDVGTAYHARISSALVELASATTEVLKAEGESRLRVWCVPGLATQWLTDRLAEFSERWPEYKIELRPTDTAPNLLMHEADVDIRYYGDAWTQLPSGRGLKSIELARPKLMAVASPALASQFEGIANPQDFLEAPLLHEDNDEQWRAWLRENGLEVKSSIAGQVLWHAHLAISAAKKGRGIALASLYLVESDLKEGALVEISSSRIKAAVIGSYALVTREDCWSRPAISKLRTFLQSKATLN